MNATVKFWGDFVRLSLNRILFRIRFPGRAIRIHPSCRIPWSCKIKAPSSGGGRITIGANCWMEDYARLMTYGGDITIGDNCSINDFTIIRGGGGVSIGNNVRIGPHCVLTGVGHKFDRTDIPIREQGLVRGPVSIGDDVWIGAGCTVVDGVVVGKGVVVGAGSVVTRAIPEYSVAAGVPARVIKNRKTAPRQTEIEGTK